MPKGPTWAQIHNPTLGNQIESLQVDGYERRYEEMGRTRIVLACPFCGLHVTAYVWSLAGGGKRCECGAMCGSDGTFHHWVKELRS